MMKKLFFNPILWVLFLILLPAAHAHAQALSGYCGREVVYNNDSTNLTWQVDTAQRTLTIFGAGRMYDYSIDTKAPWYPWRNYIERIVLPNGLTEIGTYAMYDLDKMDSIRWGQSLTIIRDNAFNNCDGLTHLILPASLITIMEYAFSYCNRLKHLQMGDNVESIESMAFVPTDSLETIDFGNSPTYIHSSAFAHPWWGAYKYNLISIKARRIKRIDAYAFYVCPNLISLQLGDSIERIEGESFYQCNALPSVHFPATLNYLDGSSFAYAYVLDTITVNPSNTTYNSNDNCNAVMRTTDNVLILGCKSTSIPSATTRIGNSAFRGCIGLQTVSFPNNLASIEERAFEGCTSITSIILPESLTHIGDHTFSDCSNLQSINLPNSVTSIDCHAFYGCQALTQPIYNNKLFARLPHSYKGTYIVPEYIKTICCGAFHSCDSIQSVQLPDSLLILGGEGFRYCRQLSSITIPKLVRTIEAYTFEGCSSLQNVTLSDSLTSIQPYAFRSCHSLVGIVIPNAVKRIEYRAFEYCSSLASITFPANLEYCGDNLFEGCTNMKSIVWNARDMHLHDYFYNQSEEYIRGNMYWMHPLYSVRQQIQSFTFGDSVHVIPRYLCYEMEKLMSLSFGCELDSIENHVFEGCKRISSINWNVRSCNDPKMYIEAPFYYIRDSITTFTFGDSVRHIPAYLCHGMSGLHQVHIPKNVSSIGDYAFRYLGVLDSISVDASNTYYDCRGNCNALIETGTDLLMLGCYKTQIPGDIKGVDACAFRNVRNLTTVTLPESVTMIGKEAFNGCVDLKNLTLSSKIGAINDYAFQDCDSLYSITLPDSLWFIGLRAFANCTHLQDITIPEKVELLDQYAFSGCNSMRSITCNAPVPPNIQETTFRGTSCPIYVPCPSITAYRKAPIWADYGSRVSGLFFYTLTVRPNDYSFGRVSIVQQPDCEHYAIVEADPILGYQFVSWQDTLGNVLSTNSTYEFYLDEDKSIIGVFTRKVDALEDVDSNSKIWVNGRLVKILSEQNTVARLYDLMGHEVDASIVDAGVEASLHAPNAGIYVVQTDGNVQKVIVK